jgi:phosphoglycerol transferase
MMARRRMQLTRDDGARGSSALSAHPLDPLLARPGHVHRDEQPREVIDRTVWSSEITVVEPPTDEEVLDEELLDEELVTRVATPEDPSGTVGHPPTAMRSASALRRSLRRSERRADVIGATSAAVGSLIAAFIGLQLWMIDPRVPMGAAPAVDRFASNDDLLSVAGFVTMDTNPWFFDAPRLGAPFGQDLRFFPAASGEALHVMVIKFLGLFTDNMGLVSNAFALATFPAVAVAAYIAARMLRVARPFAVAFAIVFAALPLHFLRVGVHSFLADYSTIPLMVALSLRQAGEGPLIRRVPGARLRGLLHRDLVWGLVILIIAGTNGLYYAVFSIVLLMIAAVIGAMRRQTGSWLGAGAGICVITVLLGVQILPSALAQRSAGGAAVQERSVVQLEEYALRPSVMLSPVTDHRIGLVADFRARLPPLALRGESESEALGLAGTLGFALAVAVAVGAMLGRRSPRWIGRLGDAPLFVGCIVAIATVDGFNVFSVYLGAIHIRAWNRASVVIACLALLLLAQAGSGLARTAHQRPGRGRLLVAPLLAAVVTLAVLDQTTAAMVPSYQAEAATWASDRDLIRQIEASLPAGAAVFNLPVADFPEAAPMYDMLADSQLIGYIHSRTLRWSYGGVKRREADWRYGLPVSSPSVVDELIITGFSGALVDRRGYGDAGEAIDRTLTAGGANLQFSSADGHQRYYSFAERAASVDDRIPPEDQPALREAILRTPLVTFGEGFDGAESDGANYLWHWVTKRAEMTIVVDESQPVAATITFDVRTFTPGEYTLFAQLGTGPITRHEIGGETQTVTIDIELQPGDNQLFISSDAPPDTGPDPRRLVFQLFGFPRVQY